MSSLAKVLQLMTYVLFIMQVNFKLNNNCFAGAMSFTVVPNNSLVASKRPPRRSLEVGTSSKTALFTGMSRGHVSQKMLEKPASESVWCNLCQLKYKDIDYIQLVSCKLFPFYLDLCVKSKHQASYSIWSFSQFLALLEHIEMLRLQTRNVATQKNLSSKQSLAVSIVSIAPLDNLDVFQKSSPFWTKARRGEADLFATTMNPAWWSMKV